MASMGGIIFHDIETYVRKVKTGGMLNNTLKSICSTEGLKTNGVKAELQTRIIDRLRHYAEIKDEPRYNRLKRIIESPQDCRNNYGNSSSPAPAAGAPTYTFAGSAMQSNSRPHGGIRLEFKPSPFYSFYEQLGDVKPCDTMTHHRHTVTLSFKVQNHPILSRVPNDPTLRIMVFCATEGSGKQDVTFPHQSELKVNGGQIIANLRGLKNKPGSTRPVDITKDLRLKVQGYDNRVDLTYALTTKAGGTQKFYLVLYVVKTVGVPELVKKLESGKKITKELVVNDMVSKARDADIVPTGSVLSLKCPITTSRILLPCRSIACRHNQCFDASSYLQLQEQAPTWLCPICNTSAPFETLVVDEYVKDILQKTSKSVDEVFVEPNGVWKLYTKPDSAGARKGVASDSDDDIIEIISPNGKASTPALIKPPPFYQTPSTREQSSSSAVSTRPNGSSTSGKRPIQDVIDLTSSGDEEEAPRPAKKLYTNAYSHNSAPPYRPVPR